jgi:hypothetical protein
MRRAQIARRSDIPCRTGRSTGDTSTPAPFDPRVAQRLRQLEHNLVVEVDGHQLHGHRSAFERDRKKDQILIVAGYTMIRITWLQLTHEPLRAAAVIAATLTVGRTPG